MTDRIADPHLRAKHAVERSVDIAVTRVAANSCGSPASGSDASSVITWSEGGGRIEPCKDGEERWVKLPPATMATLRAHLEAMDLEGSVKEWPPAARQLVFPYTVGRITRCGAFLELVWQPLLTAEKLPYRRPHAMRHSYATWMLEAGADLRWVKDQLGHASIEETEGTYGHLERERHERRVDLDSVLGIGSGASTGVHASDAGAAIEGQLRDLSREDFMVEVRDS